MTRYLLLLFGLFWVHGLFASDVDQVAIASDKLIRETVTHVCEEDKGIVLSVAAKIAEEQYTKLSKLQDRLGKNQSHFLELAKYYPYSSEVLELYEAFNVNNLGTGTKNRLQKKRAANVIEAAYLSGIEFLKADALAWKILLNSLSQQLKPESLLPIITEALRFYVTACGDYFRNFESSATEYLLRRSLLCKDLLVCLLVQLDLFGCAPVADSKDCVLHSLKLVEKPDWYISHFLVILSRFYSESEEFLELNQQDIDSLIEKKPKSEMVGEDIAQKLSKTVLFQILDYKTRQSHKNKFHLLNEYSIFSGTIDVFLQQQQDQAMQDLYGLEENLGKTRTGKKGNKANVKQKNKGKRKIKKQRAKHRKGKKSSKAKGSINNFKDKSELLLTSSTCGATDVSGEDDNSGWIKVEKTNKVNQPKQKVPVSYKTVREIESQIQLGKLHYYNYTLIRNLCFHKDLAYLFDGKIYDTKDHFANIAVIQNDAKQYISYLNNRRGHTNIRVPNLAKFFIRFHLNIDGNVKMVTFVDSEAYMSGAQLFHGKKELDFKQMHKIKIAYNDFLNQSQKHAYWQTTAVRNLFINHSMQDQIYNKIVAGRWVYNALHSEVGICLDLINNKLLNYLKCFSNSEKSCEIQAVVLGISSLYDCCFRCRNMLQGFQWRLKSVVNELLQSIDGRVTISNNLKTLILAQGQIRDAHANDDQTLKNVPRSSNLPSIVSQKTAANQYHKFAFERLPL